MKQVFISSLGSITAVSGFFEVLNPSLNFLVALLTLVYIARNLKNQNND